MWKKLVLVAVLSCIATLAVTGTVLYYLVYEPFRAEIADVEIKDLTGDSLEVTVNAFNANKSKGYSEYMRKGFDFDLTAADEYCIATVTVKVYNPSVLTTAALYLFPKNDNDVICYLEPNMKSEKLLSGETKDIKSTFVCRKNGKTDEELTEYISGLEFYLWEEDNTFGKKKVKVSPKASV